MSSTPGQHRRLLRHDPHAAPAEAREADDDVLRELRVHLEKVAVVDHRANHRVHVVAARRLVGNDRC